MAESRKVDVFGEPKGSLPNMLRERRKAQEDRLKEIMRDGPTPDRKGEEVPHGSQKPNKG